jgi:ABC-type spermidine/putrescine transport system permease subunit II
MPFRFVRRLYFAYLGFILAVLYFPFVIMGVLSFQGPRGGHTFPLRGVSTIWYWIILAHSSGRWYSPG